MDAALDAVFATFVDIICTISMPYSNSALNNI